MLTSLEKRVLLTVAYSLQFKYAPTVAEVVVRLPGLPQVSFSDIKTAVTSLYRQNLLRFIAGRLLFSQSEGVLSVIQQRQEVSKEKWREAAHLVGYLRWVPWIQAVSITGSLAVNNARPDDDIDVMVVTYPHSLWLTRVVVTGIAMLAGKRRTWYGEEKNSWCFNLWLEETQLALPPTRFSLYTAYEVCQARFLFDRAQIEQRFLQENSWVKTYLPRWWPQRLAAAIACSDRDDLPSGVEWGIRGGRIAVSGITMMLNLIAFLVQLAYMWRHKTNEQVALRLAFFHPRNTRQWVKGGWKQVLLEQL